MSFVLLITKRKELISMNKQDELRKLTRVAKACSEDITYKDLAESIDININSFYNWLNGYYELSREKARYLEDIVINLAD
jgi:transposase-like protein